MSSLRDRAAAYHARLAELEAAAEAAIAALDAFDGDADLEPDAALTAFHGFPGQITVSDDREGDDEREADSADDEPLLGAVEQRSPGRQGVWNDGGADDREFQNEDGDGDPDDEPSLGSLGGTAPSIERSQGGWPLGVDRDQEQECEDEGALGWPESREWSGRFVGPASRVIGEDEPSLGSLNGTGPGAEYKQFGWAQGDDSEREEQCEGEGDYDEREPEQHGDMVADCPLVVAFIKGDL